MAEAKPRTDTDLLVTDFMRFVEVKKSGCWEWQGALRRGYGVYRRWRAHRASWLLFRGVDPGYMHVCHHCDNPSCVNPNHLFLGDAKANATDRQAKGRNVNLIGEAHGSAKITNEQAKEIKRLADEGRISQRQIAMMFGTTQSNVSHIKRGKYWRCLNVGG